MKKLLLLNFRALLIIALYAIPFIADGQVQQLTLDQYTQAKAANLVDGKKPATFLTNDTMHITARIAPNVPVNPASSSCSCWQNRDASFSVVPFSGYLPPAYRNDDGFTSLIPIPFNFCLYGQTWNSLYINNNGNVSFGAPYSTFTATGFPNASFEMVAPFWADVDTRSGGSGLVYYKITPTYMIVQWDSVGYYNSHSNLRNTFQLIITDGNDPLVPNGNVSFCYKDMQWTTGDASSGVGGFGGSDAVVGANRGDGVNYIQFGAFNQPGGTYNGPQTANSGIDWLDNQSFTFDACTNSNNIPPTPAGLSSCDTLRICQGDSLPLNIQFFSPEVGQVTTITVNSAGVNGYTIISNTSGNTAQLVSYLIGQSNNIGYNTITITATDNGTPNANTIITTVILVTASPTSSVTSTNSSCTVNDGTATVTASGGSGSYTYSWSPSGGTGATATGLAPGTYTCTITDAVTLCSSRQTVIIGGGGTVSATSSSTNITCNGANNGTATVVASGGTPAYSYSWSPSGGTAATASGLSSGSYSCTITDANGCVNTQTFNITQPSVLAATSAPTNALCNGGNGSITASPSGGTPSYTYAWAPSGGSAATTSAIPAGCYTCTITDANGCITTTSACITEPTPLTCTISVVNSTCSGASATANVSGGTPFYSYSWSTFAFTQTVNNLSTGNYSVNITDLNGCVTTQTVAITSTPVLTAVSSWTSVFCFGDSTGAASVIVNGGTPAYTYSWAPYGGTSSSASGLAAGTYTCAITDANGCTATRMFTLTQPSQVTSTSSQTDNLCFTDQNGSVTLSSSGGVPGYTYAWAPSGGNNPTASGLGAGSYTATITDSNGCNSTVSVTITSPPALTCSVTVVNASCSTPGSATASPSGGVNPYSYSWSSGGSSATENNLPAGTYTVTITDANNCVTTQTASITTASPMSATAVSTNISCFGGSNGSATVTPQGGTTPFTYSWSPSGGNNATASGLSTGNYTCTITDANGCTATQSVAITQPSQIAATSSQTNVSCNGSTDATASVTPSGGTPGYTYAWSPSGGTASSASSLGAGTYVCTISDANGCTHTQSFVITAPAPLVVAAPSIHVCEGNGTVTITAIAIGGTTPYSYSWSNGPTSASQNVSVSSSTNFTCTVTDANGCITSDTALITVDPLPSASITSNTVNGIYVVTAGNQLCFDDPVAGVTSWNWTFPNDSSTLQSPCVNITSADTGTYCATLIVSNAQGCLDLSQYCIEITDAGYFIPNVFSPNADGTNDVFMIQNSGMQRLHCVIYNRWGELIYEWDSPTGYWDGRTTKGNEAVDGVYYWTVDMTDYSGKNYADHGFVQLIRGTK